MGATGAQRSAIELIQRGDRRPVRRALVVVRALCRRLRLLAQRRLEEACSVVVRAQEQRDKLWLRRAERQRPALSIRERDRLERRIEPFINAATWRATPFLVRQDARIDLLLREAEVLGVGAERFEFPAVREIAASLVEDPRPVGTFVLRRAASSWPPDIDEGRWAAAFRDVEGAPRDPAVQGPDATALIVELTRKLDSLAIEVQPTATRESPAVRAPRDTRERVLLTVYQRPGTYQTHVAIAKEAGTTLETVARKCASDIEKREDGYHVTPKAEEELRKKKLIID